MIGELGYGIVVIPFVAIVANVGIAKAFGKLIFNPTKSQLRKCLELCLDLLGGEHIKSPRGIS